MISRGAVAPRSPSPGAAPGKPPGAPLTAYATQRAFNEDDRHIGATKKILRRAGRIRTDDYSLFLDYIADKNFAFCEGGRQVSGPPPRYNGEVSGGYIPCDITKSVEFHYKAGKIANDLAILHLDPGNFNELTPWFH